MGRLPRRAGRAVITTPNLDAIRSQILELQKMEDAAEVSMTLNVESSIVRWLVDQIDEAQANIDAAREHLQSVVSEQRYVGTRVQAEAQRALDLLDGEPDGAEL